MWHFMDILHFCPFVVEDKKQKGPNSTGEIRLTLCRAVSCIWLISLCSCMWLRMDSDFPEGMKRIHNKTTAILRWFMFNPYCCLQTVWGVIVVKGEGGKELYLAVILPNVLNISYYWHFTLKQEVWAEEQMQLYWAAAQLKMIALAIIHERFSRNLQNICG